MAQHAPDVLKLLAQNNAQDLRQALIRRSDWVRAFLTALVPPDSATTGWFGTLSNGARRVLVELASSDATAAADMLAALGNNGWQTFLNHGERAALIDAAACQANTARRALAVFCPVLNTLDPQFRNRLFHKVISDPYAAADLVEDLVGAPGMNAWQSLTSYERQLVIDAVKQSASTAKRVLVALFHSLDRTERKKLIDALTSPTLYAYAVNDVLVALFHDLSDDERDQLLRAVAESDPSAVRRLVVKLGFREWQTLTRDQQRMLLHKLTCLTAWLPDANADLINVWQSALLQLPTNERDDLIDAIANNESDSLCFIAGLGADGWQQLTRDQQRMLLRKLISQEDVAAYLRHKNVVWHDCLEAWLPDANADLINAWQSALYNGQLPPNVSAIIALLFPRTSSCRQRRHSTRQP
ncbi:MAG: hypothetical protein RMJ48_04165 [Roseiflexaceae bacterium]|nr:hypothetical protein [Roseiflexaceae bacterium]